MKIHEMKPEPQFHPITLTFDTPQEWQDLKTVLAFALNVNGGLAHVPNRVVEAAAYIDSRIIMFEAAKGKGVLR